MTYYQDDRSNPSHPEHQRWVTEQDEKQREDIRKYVSYAAVGLVSFWLGRKVGVANATKALKHLRHVEPVRLVRLPDNVFKVIMSNGLEYMTNLPLLDDPASFKR